MKIPKTAAWALIAAWAAVSIPLATLAEDNTAGYIARLLEHAVELQSDSKYAGTEWFDDLAARIPALRKKTVEDLNRMMGLAYVDKYTIVLRFEDQNEDGARKFNGLQAQRVTATGPQGEFQRIHLFLEYLKNGQADPAEKLLHEMSHAIMRELMPQDAYLRIPQWVREGTAVYMAGQEDDRVQHILGLKAEDNPFSLIQDLKAKHASNDYARDSLVFHYLVERFGPDKYRLFMKKLVIDRMPAEKAIEAAVDKPFDEFRNDALAFAVGKIKAFADKGDTAYKEAFQYYRLSLFDRAISAFAEIIDAHPESYAAAASSYYLGKCYFYKREYDKAAAAFLGHIVVYSGKSGLVDDAKWYVGMSKYQKNDLKGCAQEMSEFIRDYPYSASVLPKAYYYLGDCQMKLGLNDEARRTFKRLAESYPGDEYAKKALERSAGLDAPPEVPGPDKEERKGPPGEGD